MPPTIGTNYQKAPEATAEAFAGGWFHSSDLAVMHPDVMEVAVVPVPDKKWEGFDRRVNYIFIVGSLEKSEA